MPEEQNTENPLEEKLFDKMAGLPPDANFKKLHRSDTNVVLTGTCAGIANYLKMDVANIRLAALLSILLGGWSIAAYFIAALLLPVEKFPAELTPKESSALQRENLRTLLSGIFILTGLHYAFIYMGIGNGERFFILPNGFTFPIISISAGIFFLLRSSHWYNGSDHICDDFFSPSKKDKKFMGVCGGLAGYLGVDSSAVRVIFVLSTMLTFGLFALVYIVLGLSRQTESGQNFE